MVFICWGCSVNAGWLQCVPACPLPNECPLHRMVHQGSLGALGESLSLSAKAQMQWTPAELAPNESSSALESKNQRSLLGFVRRCHWSH